MQDNIFNKDLCILINESNTYWNSIIHKSESLLINSYYNNLSNNNKLSNNLIDNNNYNDNNKLEEFLNEK